MCNCQAAKVGTGPDFPAGCPALGGAGSILTAGGFGKAFDFAAGVLALVSAPDSALHVGAGGFGRAFDFVANVPALEAFGAGFDFAAGFPAVG